MKLYHSPGTCSFAVLQILCELDLPFSLEVVDLRNRRTRSGHDFMSINPNGYVPALELDCGEILLEAPAILQFLADQKPDSGLAPPPSSLDRVRLQSHLNYAAAELHKSFAPFFAVVKPEGELHRLYYQRLSSRLDRLETLLRGNGPWLMGERFSVADAYTAVLASWTESVGLERSSWPLISALVARVFERPSALDALCREEAEPATNTVAGADR